jgi:hypothetical protein
MAWSTTVWEEGKTQDDLPLAIMVDFDGYKGPFFEDTRTVPAFLAGVCGNIEGYEQGRAIV